MKKTEVKKQESLPPIDIGSKNDLRPSPEVLYRLGERLKSRFEKMKSYRERTDWEMEKADAFRAYHMHPKNRPLPYPGAANLTSPFSRIGVDSFHANVMASLFVDGTRLRVTPLLIGKDFASTAKKAADYMTYVMNHEADSYNCVDDAGKKSDMYGIGYLEPHYMKEEIWETVEVIEKQNVPGIKNGKVQIVEKEKKKTQKKKRVVFDGTKIDSIPVENIYLSPFFRCIEDAVKNDVVFKYIGGKLFSEIKERTKDDEEDRPSYYIKSQVEKIKTYVSQKILKDTSSLDQAKAEHDGFYMDLMMDQEQVELAQSYLWEDIDGDGIKEEITAVFHVPSGVVIRASLSKCRLVELNPRPVDGRFYGDGIPKICRPLDEEWETFHNTRANAGQWENTTFGFYRAGGRLNPQRIVVQPGHFYPVDDPREIQFANPPRTGASYFQEESLMWSIFERIFALDENVQGVGSRRGRSATETINVSQRASIRFSNPFNRIVCQLNKLLDHIWELNVECAPKEKEYYVVGADGTPMFETIQRQDFKANMKFALSISSVFDQQMIRDTMLLAYRMFLPNPLVQSHPEILYDLSQKTLDKLDIDVELPKPPQAKTLSPFEEHEMFQRGEYPEPEVGEDVDYHLKVHMNQLNSKDIKDWDPEALRAFILHIDKTKILKATLESANLNKSGMAPQGMGQPQGKQPGFTANRNPTQMFNTARAGESPASMVQNLKNGGANVEENLNGVFNQRI